MTVVNHYFSSLTFLISCIHFVIGHFNSKISISQL